MAYLTNRKCPKCGDLGRRCSNICPVCLQKEADAKQKSREQELEDLKELTVEERLERIEKWMQSHSNAGHYRPPTRYG
jgi:hypothetical protein